MTEGPIHSSTRAGMLTDAGLSVAFCGVEEPVMASNTGTAATSAAVTVNCVAESAPGILPSGPGSILASHFFAQASCR